MIISGFPTVNRGPESLDEFFGKKSLEVALASEVTLHLR